MEDWRFQAKFPLNVSRADPEMCYSSKRVGKLDKRGETAPESQATRPRPPGRVRIRKRSGEAALSTQDAAEVFSEVFSDEGCMNMDSNRWKLDQLVLRP